jgi:hypothetical protein
MDVVERIAAGLPRTFKELAANGPHQVAELWLLARAYSRLGHKTPPGRDRRQCESLKTQCVRLALATEPDLFLVMVDPGLTHLWLIYHRVERTLLHVPVKFNLRPAPALARCCAVALTKT